MALHDRELHARNNDEHVRPVDVLSRVLAQKYKIIKEGCVSLPVMKLNLIFTSKPLKSVPKLDLDFDDQSPFIVYTKPRVSNSNYI